MFKFAKLNTLIIINFILVYSDDLHPEYDLTQDEYIVKYNYHYEAYDVKTEDNYILTIIRIPYGRNQIKGDSNKNPVLIGHGLASSSFHWLVPGPNRSLAFRLADEGYDVWLTNSRGNKYSRKHVFLNPDAVSNSYWNFSFHESGYYDMPGVIDFILNKTGKQKIIYIGMSQGTTNFFVMGSTRPEYNKKIQLMVALAPVTFMTNPSGTVLQLLKNNENLYNYFAKIIKEIEIPKILVDFIKYACTAGDSPFLDLCFRLFIFVFNSDPRELDMTHLTTFISGVSGISSKIGTHYIQYMRTDSFQYFDYGSQQNLIHYGQSNPPQYDLKLVTAPVKLVNTLNDIFVNMNDLKKLKKMLPNVIEVKNVKDKMFGHVDFLVARDVNSLVYDDVIDTIEKYKNQ